MSAYVDPLREPTNSRSRIRQARQKEVSALYEATFDRRVAATKSKTEKENVAPPSVGTSFCGKTVNVNGQAVDGKDAAIARLLHGDFYTVRGLGVGELHTKPEGKLMRFRSAGPPRDVRRDVGTETFPNQAHPSATWVPPPPVDQMQDEAERMELDEAPWHMSRPHNSLWGARPSSAMSRPASTYRNPTFSSARKNADGAQRLLSESSSSFPAGRPTTASSPSVHKLSRQQAVNPYESALQKQNSHAPGQATVVSRNELERIREIAARKEYTATSARSGYYPKDSIELQ